MAYIHNGTLHKKQVRSKRFRMISFFVVVTVFIMTSIIGVDWIINKLSDSNTVVTKENNTSVQSANVSVYRSEYFQFQAPESWISVVSETTPNRFVYVKNNGNLVTQKFTVFVNRQDIDREADFDLTRVVPIQFGPESNFERIGEVSSHCTDSFPIDGNRDPRRIEHSNVSFVCNPDSQQYNIVVGVSGESEKLPVTLKDNRKINLTLVYSDLTAYPGNGDLYNIIDSFRTL